MILESRLKQISSAIQAMMNERDSLESTIRRERASLRQVRRSLQDSIEALEILNDLSQQAQQQAHKRIAKIVSRCLAAVFPDPYVFKIVFERKRNRTEARMILFRDGEEYEPAENSGGVFQITSFALRIARIMLSGQRRFLALDEPFTQVDNESMPRVRELIDALSKELDFQFVIATHLPLFRSYPEWNTIDFRKGKENEKENHV